MSEFMSVDIAKHTEEMNRRKFEAMAHHFFDTWQPKDPYEASRFSSELFSLVRQIYIDASLPQNELLSKIIACLPIQSPFIKEKA